MESTGRPQFASPKVDGPLSPYGRLAGINGP